MHVTRRTIAIACLLAAAVLAPTATSATATPAPRQAYVLPDAEQRLMTADNSGIEYRISIATPSQPAPEGGYPVVYVLDGDAMFLTTVEAVRAYARRRDEGAHTHALVVGIGYPEGTDIPKARTFDLTPPLPDARGPNRTGGAAEFIEFIERQLKPAIARDYPVDAGKQTLMGHSLAGQFVLRTLTSHPDAFQTWVAMSSSFWFGDHAVLPRIEEFAAHRGADATPVRLLLTVGEFEERPRPEAWAEDPERAARALDGLLKRGQVTHARNTAARLAALPGMLVDFVEIPGEDHGTVIPASISRGVTFALVGPTVVPPVPTGREYLDLGPEGRYRLRMQVRALPDAHRIPWLNGLKASLKSSVNKKQHAMLHDERLHMDARYGSLPHQVNADP